MLGGGEGRGGEGGPKGRCTIEVVMVEAPHTLGVVTSRV